MEKERKQKLNFWLLKNSFVLLAVLGITVFIGAVTLSQICTVYPLNMCN